jgi:glycine oxidase
LKIVIVGAGVAGRSVAHALLARGVPPTMVAPDHGATGRGAGIVSAQFSDARRAALARRSARIIAALVAVHRCGHAQIATTSRGAALLAGLTDVEDRLPSALVGAFDRAFRRRIAGAVFAPHDFWCDRDELLATLGAGARRMRARVLSVRDGVVVTDRGMLEADRVVVASGAGAARLVRGLALQREAARLARVRLALPAMFHVVETGVYGRPDGAASCLAGNHALPQIRRAMGEMFGGAPAVRDAGGAIIVRTRDDVPVLRRVSETVFVLTGLGGDGLALAPALGESAAEWLLGAGPLRHA